MPPSRGGVRPGSNGGFDSPPLVLRLILSSNIVEIESQSQPTLSAALQWGVVSHSRVWYKNILFLFIISIDI